ncbi:MAG: DUF1761 family protein [Candidatus Nomurabacteria bacterium]
MMTIILFGILGAIISAVIGTLWYSMGTPMGKIHMKSLGFDKLSKEEQKKKIEEAKPNMWKSYLLQMFLSFLTSAFIAAILSYQKSTVLAVYVEIFAIWFCFTIPLIGQALLWSNCDKKLVWKKFFSDSFSNLVTFLVIVFIFSLII